MKTLKISNGEIRKGYELPDLSESIKQKVIQEHREFLISLPVSVENEDGELEDEYQDWVEDREVIECIEINNYLYDEDGELLPICYHIGKNNEVLRMSYGRKDQYSVEFI